MAWFKIDDGFHCHPKVFAAGTPAVGLYVRCGSWAAQQVTDGAVPKHVAKMYGTPRMIKALVDAGLWHQRGHDCPSCPEVDANSYLIHQYLERNSSRVEVELARKAKSERQQRWREGKRKQQAKDDSTPPVDAHVDASTRRRGDAAPSPAHPIPSPPTEEKAKTDSYAHASTPQIPQASQPLVAGLQAEQMHVGWDLSTDEWFIVEALIKRCGVPALITSARSSWQGARKQPRSARYFLPAWRQLPDSTPELPGGVVPIRPAGRSTTDERVAQGLALAAEFRALENGDTA